MKNRIKSQFAGCGPVLTLLIAFATIQAQENMTANYIVVKYGDEVATQGLAGGFLDNLAEYLGNEFSEFEDKVVRGHIANTPESAGTLLKSTNPVLAFVSIEFYLDHLLNKADMQVVAQVPRIGADKDRYYLIVGKDGPASLAELKNQTVRTKFAFSMPFLERVVFPPQFQPGEHFTLQAAENLADEIFLIIENAGGGFNTGEIGSASALLLDEELKHFFQEDELVWPEMKVIWQSDFLPPGLVVALGTSWNQKTILSLLTTFKKMQSTDLGAEILAMMQSPGFTPVDRNLLTKVTTRYLSRKTAK